MSNGYSQTAPTPQVAPTPTYLQQLQRLRDAMTEDLRRNRDNDRVDGAISQATGGTISTLPALLQRISYEVNRNVNREVIKERTAGESERKTAQRRRAQAVMSGMTIGAFPAIAGAASRVLPGGYQGAEGAAQLKGLLEGERDIFREEHPWQSAAYETAGGVAGALTGAQALGAPLAALPFAGRLAGPAARVAQTITKTPLRRLGTGIAGAGVEGATQAGIEAPPGEAAERARGAIAPSMIGGAAFGVPLAVAGRVGRSMGETAAPGLMAPQRAEDLIQAGVGRAGGPEALLRREAEFGPTQGPRATLAELDPAMRDEAIRASTRAGGREILERELRPGAENILEETVGELRRITGEDMTTHGRRAMEQSNLADIQGLYRTLEETFPDLQSNRALDELLTRPKVAEILGDINQELSEMGAPTLRQLVVYADDVGWIRNGDVSPDFRTLQRIKTGLDDLVDNTKGKAARRDVANLRNEFRETVYNLMDDVSAGGEGAGYQAAQQRWGSQLRVIEALDDGSKFFQKSADEIAEDFGRMAPDAQQAYRASAINSVIDQLEKRKRGASPDVIFDRPAVDRKLRLLFESGDQYDEFQQFLELKSEQLATYRGATAGSQTQPRQQLETGLTEPFMAPVVSGARTGGVGGAAGEALRQVFGSRVPGTGFPDRVSEELARRMTTPDVRGYIQSLQRPRMPRGTGLLGPATTAAAGARTPQAVDALKKWSPELQAALDTFKALRGGM